MYSIDLSGKNAVVLGVANHRSIAWHIAQALHSAGANLYLTYQNERLGDGIRKLTDGMNNVTLIECDVSEDENVESAFGQIAADGASVDLLIHSIAFANRDDLGGDFSQTGRDGFRIALEVSAYSLIPVARYAAPLMPEGGTIVTLTFQASDRVFPGYNIMGTAKAALENEVKQLAYELGPRGIRVNALSPGPLDTLSSRAIHGYVDMKRIQAERSPIQRNITHDEVAKAALFLLSDLSSGITGHILPIDGGYQIAGV
ncbi:MAG: enoyl-ACP reductase [Chloroflexi bacterium]|nr:enoyl-ACP reductase [Chloroflexota bacterium]